MNKIMHGIIRGKTIELFEESGVVDGQEVEVEVRVKLPTETKPEMTPGLEAIYAILGESYDTGEPDLAERHNEHQP